MGAPLRLTSIRLAPPPPTTRTGFLSTLLSPFLGPSRLPDWVTGAPPPPESLHEILLSTKALVQHIDQLNVFDMERVGIRLEPSPSGNPADVEMLLTLREKGRLFLKAGTEFGSNEGGGVSCARVVKGRADETTERDRTDTQRVWRCREPRVQRVARNKDKVGVPGNPFHTTLRVAVPHCFGLGLLPRPRQHGVREPPRAEPGRQGRPRRHNAMGKPQLDVRIRHA